MDRFPGDYSRCRIASRAVELQGESAPSDLKSDYVHAYLWDRGWGNFTFYQRPDDHLLLGASHQNASIWDAVQIGNDLNRLGLACRFVSLVDGGGRLEVLRAP